MIARKSLLIVISKVITAILSLVSFVFILRFMGFASTDALRVYGSIVTAMSFVATFTFIADLGFGMAHVKRISEGKDLAKCIGTYMTIRLCLTASMIGIIFSSIAIWKFIFHGSFSYAIDETLVYIFILYYIIFNISSIATSTFDAKTETAKSQLSTLAEPAVRTPLIVIIGISGFVPNDLKIYYIAVAYLAGVFTLLFVSLLMFRNYTISKPDKEMFRSYTIFAIPFIVVSILGVVISYIDKLIIGYFWSPVEVGQYAGTQAITLNLYFISFAASALLFPMMSAHFSKNKVNKIRILTYKTERYLSMLITPAVFFILVFAEEILQLINAALMPAGNVFRMLALGILLSSISNPHQSQIIALNRPGLSAKISIAHSFLLIAGYFILIPSSIFGIKLFGLGINGAAIAYIITATSGFIVLRIVTWWLSRTKPQSCLILHIIAGCVMAILLYLITTQIFDFVRWYELTIAFVLGIGVYLSVLTILKELKKNDIDFVLDTLNPGKMSHYVRTEIKKKQK